MLFVSSMLAANYKRKRSGFSWSALRLVAVGVAVALLGEITGLGQGILGG